MSPQNNNEEHRLPTIPEESFVNDVQPADQEAVDTAALPQNIEDILPPASVPPVTMDENNQPPPPPYPGQVRVSSRSRKSFITLVICVFEGRVY